MPRKSDENRAARKAAMSVANLEATIVPLEVLERSVDALELALVAARDGNPNSVTDAGVAGVCAIAAAEGASLNVRINLSGLDGDTTDIVARHDIALADAHDLGRKVVESVDLHLSEAISD